MQKLVKAVLSVMDECKGIEKNLNVGTGGSSYKGVGDKDVKLKIGGSMQKHGLIILPTGVKPNTTINTWEETNQYGTKMKQSVFTEVITEYLLIHESGESVPLVGFGHGTDSQDKAAGKATTYALKYTLLYSFLVATGHIDDADNTHSDDIPTPASKPKTPVEPPKKPATPSSPPAPTQTPPAAQQPVKANEKGKLTDATLSSLRELLPTLKGSDKSAFIDKVKALQANGTEKQGIDLLREYSMK